MWILKFKPIINMIIKSLAKYIAKKTFELPDDIIDVIIMSNSTDPVKTLEKIIEAHQVEWAAEIVDILIYWKNKYGHKYVKQPLLVSIQEGADIIDKDYDYAKLFVETYRKEIIKIGMING